MNEVKQNAVIRMQKSVDALKLDLSKIRTGRAHAGILDHISVDYYGTQTLLTQLANITVADATTINIQPYEKTMIQTIEKVIRESDLGLNPSTSGELIRIPMPALTEERRKDLIKVVKSEGENSKIAIRNIRRDCNEILKKNVKSERN
jgi:ribosome recycling factor